jgi:hypothetical protein
LGLIDHSKYSFGPSTLLAATLFLNKESNMKVLIASLITAASLVSPMVYAKGCLAGAAVGGVAGHVAGHHAILGAAGGCVAGHEIAKHNDRKRAENQRHQQYQDSHYTEQYK